MIKIEWNRYVGDRYWFGWHRTWTLKRGADEVVLVKGEWCYSSFWSDRLWPIRSEGKWHPRWWYKIMFKLDRGHHAGMF